MKVSGRPFMTSYLVYFDPETRSNVSDFRGTFCKVSA